MTRLSLLLGAFAVLSAFGSTFGRLRAVPPAWRVSFGFFALTGLLMATAALLAAILLPEVLVLNNVGEIWTACTAAFQVIWHHPLYRPASILAGLALALLLGRFTWAIGGSILATRRARMTFGEPTRSLASGDVFVLDVNDPEAFSVGGRRGLVVITRGLLERLEEDEGQAVVLHEEGHLKSRHHLLLGVARATARAMSPFPPARLALDALEQAVEESADEYAAAKLGSRLSVATGLSKAALAGIGARDGALSIGDGPDVPARIRRLIAAPACPKWVRAACMVGMFLLLALVLSTQFIAGLAIVAAAHHLLGLGTVISCPLFR